MNLNEIVKQSALRWLHSLNHIENHPLVGVADREYWAWKTKDFSNGTWQAGISGFLDSIHLLDFNQQEIETLVYKTMKGTRTIQRSNGSFEEAYPYESSYAVTGLVVFNLLYSYNTYKRYFNTDSTELLRTICRSSYTFLKKSKETHGKIANHVVTTELSLLLLQKFFDINIEYEKFREVLVSLQLEPGVFAEYSGADPGYQTLLNHYWVAALSVLDSSKLSATELKKSLNFIECFVMPNREFAGLCGSRGTNVIYPSGILKSEFLVEWFEESYCKQVDSLNPLLIDVGNFVPLFNAWAYYQKHRPSVSTLDLTRSDFEQQFTSVGIHIVSKKNSFLVWNTKTAIWQGCKKENGRWVDQSFYGLILGNEITQQSPILDLGNGKYELTTSRYSQPMYSWFKAIVLRLLSVLVYCFPVLQRLLKKLLKKFIMDTSVNLHGVGIYLQVHMSDEDVLLSYHEINGWNKIGPYFMKHMASSNYFMDS